jgi:ATP phosphoribosyltransferase
MSDRLTIAIQKDGRLTKPSLKYLRTNGLRLATRQGELLVSCKNANVDVAYLRDDDIPTYVAKGDVDYGIVGRNAVVEKGLPVVVKRKLDFGQCRLAIAVPRESKIRYVQDLRGERIATSYPRILKQYLNTRNIIASVVYIEGSVEIAPRLGLADAICDLVVTGRTLRQNALRQIQNVFQSEAVLIQKELSVFRPT